MNATAENIRVSQASTNHVSRNLYKADPSYPLYTAYERLSYASLEDFTQSAKAWLGEKSELGHVTLERANWRELYEEFRGMMERAPKKPEPTPEEEVNEDFAELLESSSLGSPIVKAVSAMVDDLGSVLDVEAGLREVLFQAKSLTERLLDKAGVTYEAVREVIGGITVLKFLINGETLNVSQTVGKYL